MPLRSSFRALSVARDHSNIDALLAFALSRFLPHFILRFPFGMDAHSRENSIVDLPPGAQIAWTVLTQERSYETRFTKAAAKHMP